MVVVQLDRISKSYGSTDVFDDVTWRIMDDARVGFIGANGSGKTTLARIIVGDEEPTSGTCSRKQGLSVGYLTQAPELPGGKTVREVVLQADSQLVKMGCRMADLEAAIADGSASGEQTEEYGTLRETFRQRGGYDYEARCETVLDRLGFHERMHGQLARSLSGGQQSRLELARLLVLRPDLLILDEPTNHLDIQATEWLESFLSDYRGAVIAISHDRAFLDAFAREIAEMERGTLTTYSGNYTRYAQQKAEREAQQEKEYQEQQEFIKKTEDFIRKNIANVKKTKAAQTRRRMLENLERVEPPSKRKSVNLNFVASHRGGNEVLQVRDLAKSYGELRLFEGLSFTVRRGERVGIVGPNGMGKSTLLRVIVGEVPSDAGVIRFGTGIEAGYFDQRLEGLDPDARVIDEVWAVEPSLKNEQIRAFLGNFLFSEDDQFQRVGTLSGGEQSRVALAKLVLSRVNLLILDEPTNHLDIPSRLVLEEALSSYNGTILVVSHDRTFLRRLTSRVIWMDRHGAQPYEMGYEAFEQTRQKEALAAHARSDDEGPDAEKAQRMRAYAKRKEDERARRRLERRLEQTEARISELEERIKELDREMASPEHAQDWTKLHELQASRNDAQDELPGLYETWEELQALVESDE